MLLRRDLRVTLGSIARLDKYTALPCQGRGRGFESLRPLQIFLGPFRTRVTVHTGDIGNSTYLKQGRQHRPCVKRLMKARCPGGPFAFAARTTKHVRSLLLRPGAGVMRFFPAEDVVRFPGLSDLNSDQNLRLLGRTKQNNIRSRWGCKGRVTR